MKRDKKFQNFHWPWRNFFLLQQILLLWYSNRKNETDKITNPNNGTVKKFSNVPNNVKTIDGYQDDGFSILKKLLLMLLNKKSGI